MKQLVIAVDFDGTIVKSKYPEIGRFRFGARAVLKWLKRRGHILILNTCRERARLWEAQCVLGIEGISFNYYNENAEHLIKQYGDCRKIGADLYLDDKGFFTGWWIVPPVILWLEFKNRGGNQ